MPGGDGRLGKNGHGQIFKRLLIARASIATTNYFLLIPNSEWTPPKIDSSKVDKLQEVKKQLVYNWSFFVKRIGRGANHRVVNLEDCYGNHDGLLHRIAILKSVALFWRDNAKGLVRGHYDKLLASSHVHFARKYWIKQSQEKEFPSEPAALKKGGAFPRGLSQGDPGFYLLIHNGMIMKL